MLKVLRRNFFCFIEEICKLGTEQAKGEGNSEWKQRASYLEKDLEPAAYQNERMLNCEVCLAGSVRTRVLGSVCPREWIGLVPKLGPGVQ